MGHQKSIRRNKKKKIDEPTKNTNEIGCQTDDLNDQLCTNDIVEKTFVCCSYVKENSSNTECAIQTSIIMPLTCIVVNCDSRDERRKTSFYSVPAVLNFKCKPHLSELSKRRREKWLAAIKREDLTEAKITYQRVCSKHFISGKPAALEDADHPDWVPSQEIDYESGPPLTDEVVLERQDRIMTNIVTHIATDTPIDSNSNPHIKAEEEAEMDIKLEELHHSIDIKEDAPLLEPQHYEESKLHASEKPLDPFACDICDYKCARKRLLTNHLKTHTGPKLVTCAICDYKSVYKGYLKIHLRTHTGEKPFSCKICDYKCAQKEHLKYHVRKHTGEKPFTCEICDYKCIQKGHLKAHLRKHTGDKPFSCEICDYKCGQKQRLKCHLRTHSGDKPYTCEICDYKCAQKQHLKSHLKKHTGEKPFSCKICDYKCTTKQHLKSHLSRIHTGKKQFSCEICDYKCKQKKNLKRHLRTHSG